MNAEPTRREPHVQPQRRFSWPLAFTIIFLIAAALAALVFWRLETWPMRTVQQSSVELERLGRKARDAFFALAQMQPRVTINDRVYLEQTVGVAELALVSQRSEVEHEFEHTWAGSTKRVKLHGTFNVKAGFDLRQNVSVDVRENEIVVSVPHASILGIEQQQVDVLEFENGYWNRISAADVQNEFAALQRLAREKAENGTLKTDAERALQQQLDARLGGARPIHLRLGPAAPNE
ncbi:MAG: DUF4230 domain-containing protein [Verrucomicrobiota bacterium]|nr:DUF4230 domain-containing protein [Verrucomicrobiota bacterium]